MGNCLGTRSDVVQPVFSTPATATVSSTTDTPTTTASSSRAFSSDISISSYESRSEKPRFSNSGGSNLRKYTYSELRLATKNFKPGGQLGEGGFGPVYKGYVDEHTFSPSKPGQGIIVAVKKLNLDGLQGHKEWLELLQRMVNNAVLEYMIPTEVIVLGALHHPNLVKLIGYCAEDHHRLLVYEYMSRGSLENHLFNKYRNGQRLCWEIRLKVALGAARGLAFLHDAQTRVIYRDFKASNILLDDDFNAKLSDFGLARDGPEGDATHVTTGVMGTCGYAAPEYLATGHLSARSDVYSFGVVLLELLTGRPAMDIQRPSREQKLVEWAKPYLNDKRRVLRIMDQKLEGQYSMKGAHKIANLALRCLIEDAKARPTMIQVVETLESIIRPRGKTDPKPN